MKKLIALSLLASTLSAQADLTKPMSSTMEACRKISTNYGYSIALSEILMCSVSTTTSLPTILIEGIEIDLNSPEAQERLEAELNGDLEPMILEQMAIQKGMTTEELREQIMTFTLKVLH